MRLDHLLSKESHRLVRSVHVSKAGGRQYWVAVCLGCVPPFTDSTPDQASRWLVGRRGVGVAGWNTSAASVPDEVCRLGTLLGPEETPVGFGCFTRYHSWPGWSNALCCVGVVAAVVLGCGCVLSVA